MKADSHMHTRELERFKVQAQNTCSLSNREWLSTASLVVFPRLVKYPTNLSVISFQDASLASLNLSVALKWQWLHYESTRDLGFCHTCVTAIKTGKMKITGNVKDSAFIYNGFCNWKDATRCFSGHEDSATQLKL